MYFCVDLEKILWDLWKLYNNLLSSITTSGYFYGVLIKQMLV